MDAASGLSLVTRSIDTGFPPRDLIRILLLPLAAPGEPLLDTPDLQSLADLANSVNIVRNMRLVPVTGRTLAGFAIAALVPLLPLLLLKYPVAELTRRLFTALAGL